MMFLERLSSTGMDGSKYWYSLEYNWFAKNDLWLPNCFKGDTKFITRKGIKTLEECVDEEIEVLGKGGEWEKATVRNFGKNKLLKVTFPNKKVYYATPNHRWITITHPSGHEYIKETTDIAKKEIPLNKAVFNLHPDIEGIRHGFVFGDGRVTSNRKWCSALLCGDKRGFMEEYFAEYKHYYYANGTVECVGLPNIYKELPSIEMSDEYLFGFIVGYLASDGSVTKDRGCVSISSSKREHLEGVKNICAKLRIKTNDISVTMRKGFNDYETPMHRITFDRSYVTEDFFINPKFKEYFRYVDRRHKNFTSVVSVEETDLYEDVYCVVNEVSHTFTLDNFALTMNCTNFACGESSALCGRNVKLQIPRGNAQTWYSSSTWARSKTPKVGAIAVWGGGQYGHVGIVERINKDGTILLAQSNYTRASKASMIANYFVLGTYKCEVGKVTKGIGWTFLGYLINPYVDDKRVERDPSKYQIEVTEERVRARKSPNGEIYKGQFIPMGIYNVLEENGDWVRVDNEVWFSKGTWTKEYPVSGLIKIERDPEYEYQWSLDGNRYGDKYDITVEQGFGDEKLKADGWEEVLAVNGSLFYTYDGKHYALGVEKSRGVNNQELDMSCVTDNNEVMAIGMNYYGGLDFKKTKDICNDLDLYYGAVTGEFGVMKDGEKAEWGKEVFAEQYNAISGRTIIGTDKDGNFLSYSIKGETGKSGLKGNELYDLCKSLGFWNAICFDGGGSVFRRINKEYDISTTRKVKNCVLLYRRKTDLRKQLEDLIAKRNELDKQIEEIKKRLGM